MRARINFTVNGSEDFIILDGDSHEEIRIKAEAELVKRGGTDAWSEILEE